MKSAGNLLKETRLRLNLRYRDVTLASQRLAKLHGNDEFIIALSRLADIENKGIAPSIYRIYSLCVIYRLDVREVLTWYGVPVESFREDTITFRQPSTHLLPDAAPDDGPGAYDHPSGTSAPPERDLPRSAPSTLEKGWDLSSSGESTSTSKRIPASASWFARSIMGGIPKKPIRLGMIGEQDHSMSPIIPAGSVVLIDESRKRIVPSGWKNEFERPVYFLETRENFLCRWCAEQDGVLITIPHPASTLSPESFRMPAEVDVVGEVVGLAMRRPQVRAPRTRS